MDIVRHDNINIEPPNGNRVFCLVACHQAFGCLPEQRILSPDDINIIKSVMLVSLQQAQASNEYAAHLVQNERALNYFIRTHFMTSEQGTAQAPGKIIVPLWMKERTQPRWNVLVNELRLRTHEGGFIYEHDVMTMWMTQIRRLHVRLQQLLCAEFNNASQRFSTGATELINNSIIALSNQITKYTDDPDHHHGHQVYVYRIKPNTMDQMNDDQIRVTDAMDQMNDDQTPDAMDQMNDDQTRVTDALNSSERVAFIPLTQNDTDDENGFVIQNPPSQI